MTSERKKVQAAVEEVKKAVVGKDDVLYKVLSAILAKGHILMEDVPGVGKTTLALAFSKALGLDVKRMQFTPDVLPSDVVGFYILDNDGQFEYKPGAVLCNLFLADEINRTSSKTQSALLEVMEEGKVTVDGITRKVPDPFIVIATQNPSGSAGTQNLPESQLDRFMVKLTMGYPDLESEIAMLKGRSNANPIKYVEKAFDKEDLLEFQGMVEEVFVHDQIYEYIAGLVSETRQMDEIELGISPRGTLAIVRMAKARAFLEGRKFMTPEDVDKVFVDTCAHRILLKSKAKVEHLSEAEVLLKIVKSVRRPKL